MKRFWLLVLAALMFGQGSYAAAGAYCLHEGERSPVAAHWGHHFHSHADHEPTRSSPDTEAGFDGDCAFCHAGGVFSPASFTAIDADPGADPLAAATVPRLAGRGPDAPERPQWREPALA